MEEGPFLLSPKEVEQAEQAEMTGSALNRFLFLSCILHEYLVVFLVRYILLCYLFVMIDLKK